jgi:hypothetical protein
LSPRIAFYAVTRDKVDAFPQRLAEAVTCIRRDVHDAAF